MTDLHNALFVEKYRPKTFGELIFENKQLVINHLKSPNSLPSFIFYSNKPGTGKTSLAKLIISTLGCDFIKINASDERGIETIREKITNFARNMSSNDSVKRCSFLDEADSITKQGQDCLKSTMEEFSANSFFIMTANDVSKIIEPIQSRCVLINFEKPSKADIFIRLEEICTAESITASDAEITDLVNQFYPDIRAMIKTLQNAKIEKKSISVDKIEYEDFLKALKASNIEFMYNKAYDSNFDIYSFNRWLFTHVFNNHASYKNVGDIALALAEVEKGYVIGVNAPVIFLANMVKISRLMK